VDVYRGLFRSQSQGKEFSAYGNSLQGSGSAEGHYFAVWYDVAGTRHHSALRAQLSHAAHSLTRLRSPSAVVQVTRVACVPACDAAGENLRAWGLNP
jgi:hypothetical protein